MGTANHSSTSATIISIIKKIIGFILIDDTPVIVSAPDLMVDETDLNPYDSHNGQITANFGHDCPGQYLAKGAASVTFTGAKNSALTSHGIPVIVSIVGNDYVGKAGATEIFRLTLNKTTGAYTFKLSGVLDHADAANPDDAIQIKFGVTVKDGDGDKTDGFITVKVHDDAPVIDVSAGPVDEDGLANGMIVRNGHVAVDYGKDSPGEVHANGAFNAKHVLGGPEVSFASGGEDVVVSATDDGYTGTIHGGTTTVFTLTINDNADYTFTLYQPLDHYDPTDPDEGIFLNFGITVTDYDGDSESGTITINLLDSAGKAFSDVDLFAISDNGSSGDVLTNDTQSVDIPSSITQVKFGTTVVAVPGSGSAIIDGNSGALEMFADGTYTYTLHNTHSNLITQDIFQYTMTDADGDSRTANINLTGQGVRTVHGDDGNNVLTGGEDNDVLYGHGGADSFVYDSITEGVDTIKDFNLGEGDHIDISTLLDGFDPLTDAITDYVIATELGADTHIAVDTDGTGSGAAPIDLLVLQGVTGLDILQATNNGQAVV